ncbi:related to kinesin light chain [Serendipita indica DSM 11827]|uniref:Related to kinesin light chain n=1 Tax=Serendipita indica (strain DSM 11827) TaxID=1109443 RepID=G4TVL3_SERID|nr:related to kinesin light chain [Serendipita indica DSM 11827]
MAKEKGWLLFVDNADSPELNLRPYLTNSTHGAVIITTRNGQCANYALDGAVPVGDLEESEAVNLLHTIAQIMPASDTKSLEIVRELGMLALAITQAGVYIRDTRRLDTYLEMFQEHRSELLRKRPDIGSGYTSSTYTAFNLSFHQLPRKTQKFLKLCAFLNHSRIPTILFKRSIMSGFATYTVLNSYRPPWSDRKFITKLRKIFGKTWNEIKFQEIIHSSSQASFINVSTDGLSYTIHPLLQTYIEDSLGEADCKRYCCITTQLVLGSIWPSEGSNADLWDLLPHANSIPLSVKTKKSHGYWHSTSFMVLWGAGQHNRDLMWLENVLAITLNKCGRLDEAKKMGRDTLTLRLEISGPRHPHTIAAMSNLAAILYGRGRLDEAEKMQRDTLALLLNMSGHPNTITVMNNLAFILDNRGKTEEAKRIRQDVRALQLQGSG